MTTKVLLMLIIEHTQVDPHCSTFWFLLFCFHSYFLFPTKHFLINRFSNQHCFFNFKLFFSTIQLFQLLDCHLFISVLFHSSIINVFASRICFSLSVNSLLTFVSFLRFSFLSQLILFCPLDTWPAFWEESDAAPFMMKKTYKFLTIISPKTMRWQNGYTFCRNVHFIELITNNTFLWAVHLIWYAD